MSSKSREFIIYLLRFQIKVEQINAKWKGTIILGVVGIAPSTIHFPSSAILLRRPCWICTHDYVNLNGIKNQSKYADLLDDIAVDTIITLTLTYSGSLTLTVGHKQLDEFATGLPHHVYPVFDLYGKCERISIVHNEPRNGSPINEESAIIMPPLQPVSIDYIAGACSNSVAASTDEAVANNGAAAVTNGIRPDADRNVPQCEKADLEVHEKETDISLLPSLIDVMAAGASGSGSAM